MVRILPAKTQVDGFELPDDQPDIWGIVEEVGPPHRYLYTWWEMLLWTVFGINPCLFEKGDEVLLPRMTGRKIKDGDVEYMIFFQNEIEIGK